MTYDNKAPWYVHRSRAQSQSIKHQDFSVATTNRIRSASSLSAMFCHSQQTLLDRSDPDRNATGPEQWMTTWTATSQVANGVRQPELRLFATSVSQVH